MNIEKNNIIECPHCHVCSIKLSDHPGEPTTICEVCGYEVSLPKRSGVWLLSKKRDDMWGGYWFHYSCSKCGWTTLERPYEPKFRFCPSCGEPMIVEDSYAENT